MWLFIWTLFQGWSNTVQWVTILLGLLHITWCISSSIMENWRTGYGNADSCRTCGVSLLLVTQSTSPPFSLLQIPFSPPLFHCHRTYNLWVIPLINCSACKIQCSPTTISGLHSAIYCHMSVLSVLSQNTQTALFISCLGWRTTKQVFQWNKCQIVIGSLYSLTFMDNVTTHIRTLVGHVNSSMFKEFKNGISY